MDSRVQGIVHVRLLGGFELTTATGERIAPPRRVVRSIIALLVLAPASGWTRDELIHILWGERSEEQARASLRQALTELRQVLGDACLLPDRDKGALNSTSVVADVTAFERACKSARLGEAAELYGGALLAGVTVRGGAFHDWLVVERTRLHDMATDVLSKLAATQQGEDAMATARRLLDMEPSREESHRIVMRLHAAQGERSLASRQYQVCRDSLHRDLGVKPDEETERLHREITGLGRGTASESITTSETGLPSSAAKTTSRVSWPAYTVAGLLALIFIGFGFWRFSGSELPVTKPLVAVLPFEDISGVQQPVPLARGLTEDIITDLGRFPEFQVIASNTTNAYGGKGVNPLEAATALKAGFVVTGSIQRQTGRVRISTQLIDTGSGKSLWSERWDRPDADLFAIQSEISEQVANRLGGGNGLIQEAGRVAAHRKPPGNLSAYEFYLLGTERLEQMNRADLDEALRLLTRAVELDPGLARAWVELHHTHAVLTGFGADPESSNRLAKEAAVRALALDPSDPEAHAVRAMSYGYDGDLASARTTFETALRMAPNQFEILTFYISWASTFGEPKQGADLVERAIFLNPNFPMWAARPFAYAYFMDGRYQQSLSMVDRLESENLGNWLWPFRIGALAALGRQADVKAEMAKALQAYPDMSIENTISDPGLNDTERQRLIETLRLAGFPACAKPGELKAFKKPVRLPECSTPG